MHGIDDFYVVYKPIELTAVKRGRTHKNMLKFRVLPELGQQCDQISLYTARSFRDM